MDSQRTLYDEIGGRPVVDAITATFYDLMEAHEPAIARMHPPFDGTIPELSRAYFADFFAFWTGGPRDYLATRGHPRLGMRHGHLAIGPAERDAWLRCMLGALDAHVASGRARSALEARLSQVAHFLQSPEA
jgi:hemoglobin